MIASLAGLLHRESSVCFLPIQSLPQPPTESLSSALFRGAQLAHFLPEENLVKISQTTCTRMHSSCGTKQTCHYRMHIQDTGLQALLAAWSVEESKQPVREPNSSQTRCDGSLLWEQCQGLIAEHLLKVACASPSIEVVAGWTGSKFSHFRPVRMCLRHPLWQP